MAYEEKDLSGVLFKNDKKTNDSQPDYTGSFTINGEKKRLAAWIKTSQKTGIKFMSLLASDPLPAPTEVAREETQDSPDDLPF